MEDIKVLFDQVLAEKAHEVLQEQAKMYDFPGYKPQFVEVKQNQVPTPIWSQFKKCGKYGLAETSDNSTALNVDRQIFEIILRKLIEMITKVLGLSQGPKAPNKQNSISPVSPEMIL
ncbi:hypothetical protein ACLNBI_18355 [Pseudomonas guariconensis]|uniref:hypothetical protein n=1 Tax=Pseudomonas guariconensis TaxID=1288410 RepID=UPI0039EC55DC